MNNVEKDDINKDNGQGLPAEKSIVEPARKAQTSGLSNDPIYSNRALKSDSELFQTGN